MRWSQLTAATAALLVGLTAAQGQNSTESQGQNNLCKNFPGERGWPSPRQWAQLNSTVSGRLIQTIPMPSVCHHSSESFGLYDETACAAVQANWSTPETYDTHPAEVMNPFSQGQSCNPYTPASQPCTLGNYASYSIEVRSAEDIVAGVQFAQDRNVRLVIKNTGHDFMGKSTGAGSLSLWTHNMDTVTIIEDYQSETYQGPAAKLEAGVVAGNAYAIVAEAGYSILGGTCPSVGLAGGYTPGGGHGLLNSMHGLAADAVLEWEVVTAEGRHLVATPSQNSDLYWALCGGGAGTYAVVVSMTTKIFPDTTIGGGSLSFNSSLVGNDTFWNGVGDLMAFMPSFVDTPATMDFQVTDGVLLANNILVPDATGEQVAEMLQPLFDSLDERGIPYTFEPVTSDSFFDHISGELAPLPYGPYPTNIQLTTRLIPRAGVLDPDQNADIINAYQTAMETGLYQLGCHGLNVKNISHPDNAVLPQWRDTIFLCTVVGYWEWDVEWDEMLARKDQLVGEILPSIEAVTPGSGSYLNEIDAMYRGDWKKELYGVNYDRLLTIKQKYDPENLLYAHFGVGSDYWAVKQDGKLCKA